MKNSLVAFGGAFIDVLHPKNVLKSMFLSLVCRKYQQIKWL